MEAFVCLFVLFCSVLFMLECVCVCVYVCARATRVYV